MRDHLISLERAAEKLAKMPAHNNKHLVPPCASCCLGAAVCFHHVSACHYTLFLISVRAVSTIQHPNAYTNVFQLGGPATPASGRFDLVFGVTVAPR